jgi:hypothetical protein
MTESSSVQGLSGSSGLRRSCCEGVCSFVSAGVLTLQAERERAHKSLRQREGERGSSGGEGELERV